MKTLVAVAFLSLACFAQQGPVTLVTVDPAAGSNCTYPQQRQYNTNNQNIWQCDAPVPPFQVGKWALVGGVQPGWWTDGTSIATGAPVICPGCSGGGGGSVVLSVGVGAPVAACVGPTSSHLAVYLDLTNQNQWWCSASNTWLKLLSVTNSGPFTLSGATGATISGATSGTVNCGFTTTTPNTLQCEDSAGNITSMVLGTGAQTIFSGTQALGTSQIAAATSSTPSCALTTIAASGALATDRLVVQAASDPTSVTGYAPITTGNLEIWSWMTNGQINIKVCNPTGTAITPGALNVIVGVYR